MSREPRIDAYIAKAQPFARPILDHVRERVHAVVPDAEEAMKWSTPAFTVDGKILLDHGRLQSACGAQFLARPGLARRRRQGRAMGQFGKLTSVDDLPADAELDPPDPRGRRAVARPRPRRARPSTSPSRRRELHPDFAAALGQGAQGQGGARRLPALGPARLSRMDLRSEAGRDPAKRIATAVEWLSEGKRRHWKYENC